MQRALRERREGAQRLDLVAEELDADRLAAGRREDVDDPAAHGELAALLDAVDPLVAGERELLGELLDPRLVADARAGSAPGRDSAGGSPSAKPSADAQTSPPAASTSSARARSPTRCGGRLEPALPAHAARREQPDALVAEEPAGGLGGVPRVGVLGEEADERPLAARSRSAARTSGSSGSETRADAGRSDERAEALALGELAARGGGPVGPWRQAEPPVPPVAIVRMAARRRR